MPQPKDRCLHDRQEWKNRHLCEECCHERDKLYADYVDAHRQLEGCNGKIEVEMHVIVTHTVLR